MKTGTQRDCAAQGDNLLRSDRTEASYAVFGFSCHKPTSCTAVETHASPIFTLRPVAGSVKKPVAVCGSRYFDFEPPNHRRSKQNGRFFSLAAGWKCASGAQAGETIGKALPRTQGCSRVEMWRGGLGLHSGGWLFRLPVP